MFGGGGNRKTSASKLFGNLDSEEDEKGKLDKDKQALQKEQAELMEAATMLQSQARAFLVRSAEHEKEVQLNNIYQEDIAGVPNIDDGTMRSSGEQIGGADTHARAPFVRLPHTSHPIRHPPSQSSTTWR